MYRQIEARKWQLLLLVYCSFDGVMAAKLLILTRLNCLLLLLLFSFLEFSILFSFYFTTKRVFFLYFYALIAEGDDKPLCLLR